MTVMMFTIRLLNRPIVVMFDLIKIVACFVGSSSVLST